MTPDRSVVTTAITGLLLLFAGLAGAWLLNNFERQTREVETGYSPEARRNPFLAAQRFLDQVGYQAVSVNGRKPLLDLPPVRDTLVVNGFDSPPGEARRRSLEDWMTRGGHLVVRAGNPVAEDAEDESPPGNDFLAGFGARLYTRETKSLEKLDAKAGRLLARLRLPDNDRALEVQFNARRYLKDTSGQAALALPGGEGGAHLLQYRVGGGQLTVFSDLDFMTNRRIGEHDHALFVTRVLGTPGGRVWLLYDSHTESLLTLLTKHAPMALTSAGILLAFYLWGRAARLGPLIPDRHAERRDLQEHLDATASFFWHLDHGRDLFTTTRHRVEQAWLRRHLALRGMKPGERSAWIAQRSGMQAPVVYRALYGDPKDIREFIELSARLQTLYHRLGANAQTERSLG